MGTSKVDQALPSTPLICRGEENAPIPDAAGTIRDGRVSQDARDPTWALALEAIPVVCTRTPVALDPRGTTAVRAPMLTGAPAERNYSFSLDLFPCALISLFVSFNL